MEYLNRPISVDELENLNKELFLKKVPGRDYFTGEFYQTSTRQTVPVLYR